MKLNKEFIKHTMDGQTVLVPTAQAPFHGLIQGNRTVGVILDCLLSDTTEEEIVRALSERFDGDEAVIREDVSDTLRQLMEIGAIDE